MSAGNFLTRARKRRKLAVYKDSPNRRGWGSGKTFLGRVGEWASGRVRTGASSMCLTRPKGGVGVQGEIFLGESGTYLEHLF